MNTDSPKAFTAYYQREADIASQKKQIFLPPQEMVQSCTDQISHEWLVDMLWNFLDFQNGPGDRDAPESGKERIQFFVEKYLNNHPFDTTAK